MNEQQMNELLLQSLEHEKGGIQVYETALKCAVNDDLQEEWEKYLEETRNHERVLTEVSFLALGRGFHRVRATHCLFQWRSCLRRS